MDGGSVVLGEDDEGLVTGRWLTLPDRGDPVAPGMLHGKGWVALMYARGRMTTAQVVAAVDIARGLSLEVVASASGLRAVDPSALVVDGGNRTSPPLAPVGGVVGAPAAGRVEQWRRTLRADKATGTLHGRRGAMFVDLVVVRVIMGEVTASALDQRLGLRKDRVRDEVLRQLRAYAETFCLGVPKIPS
ncbi:hypothetical protein GBZ26_04365 [Azospirillum formosense]|uniref:Uncharacterized protein n=1 Tax=Azospirillum formosense TaxID=861533 RepID=A0ABX2KSV0_9PROT|nr:hypothetical protein [Azospirillum formosense]MBY3752486.1 hypothetical protein [Azospirillum formosense]NUB18457.1 hypothetical protein [Azospirillum formosense]